MTNRAVMQQALECIERLNMRGFILADFEDEVESAITALREALEQPAQRPWVGLTEEEVQFYIKKHSKLVNAGYDKVTDTNLVAKTFDSTGFYKEVSTVLKERNT